MNPRKPHKDVMSTKKYRPYFTLVELKSLRDMCADKNQLALHSYLHKYILDIEHGVRRENHTLQPTILERLGESPTEASYTFEPIDLNRQFQQQNNSFIGMNPRQIEILQEYRYSEGLMDSNESTEYELQLLGTERK